MDDEDYWLFTEHIDVMLRVLLGKGSARKLRLFVCACCRDVQDVMTEEEVQAVALAERYADGIVNDVEREAVICALVARADGSAELSRHGRPHGYSVAYLSRAWLPILALMVDAEYLINSEDGRPIVGFKDIQQHGYDRARQVARETATILARARQEASRGFLGRMHEMMFRCVHRLVDGNWPTFITLDGCHFQVPEDAQRVRLHDIFGNPFRPVALDPSWLTSDVVALARGIYEDRAFDRMPVLADALQDAGCTNEDVLSHCRGGGTHVRGCWVVDLLLGRE